MVKPVIVGFKCKVLVRNVKVIDEIVDVPANRIQKKDLIGTGKRKRSFRVTENTWADILLSTGVEGIGRFESQDREYGNGGVEGGGAIYHSYKNRVPLTVVPEKRKSSFVGHQATHPNSTPGRSSDRGVQ